MKSPLLFLCFLSYAAAQAATTTTAITNVIVFGDSYSDSCNYWRTSSGFFAALQYPFPACPPSPTGRAPHGPTWPEWIRMDQGQKTTNAYRDPPGGKPVQAGQWSIENYATQGATCDNNAFPRPAGQQNSQFTDVVGQIKLYQSYYNRQASSSKIRSDAAMTIAAVLIGGNEVLIAANDASRSSASYANGEAICLRARLESLHALGFRRFVLFSVPAAQYTPAIRGASAATVAQTVSLIQSINALQTQVVINATQAWRDSSFLRFPTYDLFEAFAQQPAMYGLTDVSNACGDQCPSPDQHLWYDSVHPMSRIEHIMARKIQRFLAANGTISTSALIAGSEGV